MACSCFTSQKCLLAADRTKQLCGVFGITRHRLLSHARPRPSAPGLQAGTWLRLPQDLQGIRLPLQAVAEGAVLCVELGWEGFTVQLIAAVYEVVTAVV